MGSLFDEILGLDGITILDFEENDNEIVFKAASTKKPSCPRCGQNRVNVHDSYERTIRDLPMKGKKTTIVIDTKQYSCLNEDCPQKVFVPKFDFVDGKNVITNRLEKVLAKSSLGFTTFQSVADMYYVDEETVRRAFKAYTSKVISRTKYASVKHLGIDEAHLANDVRCVLVDTSTKPSKIIDILETRNKRDVIAALEKFADPSSIETVSMDMWTGYREAVKEALPQARIVIDRYHVVDHLQKAMEKSRKACREYIKTNRDAQEIIQEERPEKQTVNHYWFRSNAENWTDKQKRIMVDLFMRYPEYELVYSYKESMRNIFSLHNRESAMKAYDYWKSDITTKMNQPGSSFLRPYSKFIKTFDNWAEWIFNFFDDPPDHRYSNGPVEGHNGVIKKSMRNGNGYGFDILRAKILYNSDLFIPNKLNAPESVVYYKNLNLYDGIRLLSFSPDSPQSRDFITVVRKVSALHPELQVERYRGYAQFIECACTSPSLLSAIEEAMNALDNESGMVKIGVDVQRFVNELQAYSIMSQFESMPAE